MLTWACLLQTGLPKLLGDTLNGLSITVIGDGEPALPES